jgi:hypothetical protein
MGNILTSGFMRYDTVCFRVGVPMLQRYVAISVTVSAVVIKAAPLSQFVCFPSSSKLGRKEWDIKELLQNGGGGDQCVSSTAA